AAGRAGGEGDRELQVGHELTHFVDQRGFPRTRWGRNDVQNSAHSMFCTCSLHFSMSDFICNPNSVMRRASPAIPDVLESSVLASRFNSCKRRSSFLPTSPPSSSLPTKCWIWDCRLTF